MCHSGPFCSRDAEEVLKLAIAEKDRFQVAVAVRYKVCLDETGGTN